MTCCTSCQKQRSIFLHPTQIDSFVIPATPPTLKLSYANLLSIIRRSKGLVSASDSLWYSTKCCVRDIQSQVLQERPSLVSSDHISVLLVAATIRIPQQISTGCNNNQFITLRCGAIGIQAMANSAFRQWHI